jgi:hypothetical protein
MHRFAISTLLIAAAALAAASQATAGGGAKYEITVTNLTRSQVLTPPVAFAHAPSYRLFVPGGAASDGLAALAQDGKTDDLVAELEASRGVRGIAVAAGPVLPGHSVKLRLHASAYGSRLGIVGMLASSNDAFFALQGERLPWSSSSSDAPVYDAGSEANLESCDHIPGPPCGNPMVSPDVKAEGFIHIHNGIHGLADLAPEDLDWRGAAARISVRRMR